MKIGVYVGSFNPVHKGHIKIANYIVDNNLVDKLLIIPTLGYWDKRDLASLDKRVDMLKFYETDKIIIDTEFSDLEYTYQVINALKEKYKNSEFSLVLGADNIVNFDKWKNYQELLNLELIIVKRDDIDIKNYLYNLGKTKKYVIINNISNMNISSTMIRNNIDKIDTLKDYVDEFVIDYIIKNNLYRK